MEETAKMKITNEIYQVGGGEYSAPQDAAVYLICFNGHAALVDAGCGYGQNRILNNIRKCGISPEAIEYLLITHCHFDHTGGIKALKEILGFKTVAHELDAPFLERGDPHVTAASWYGSPMEAFPVDIKVSGSRQEIPLGGREILAIHTPGHSPGSMVYVTESQGNKVVFAQDVHGPLHPDLLSQREDYLHSLEILLNLQADILCEGHYGVVRGKKKVSTFIRQFMNA